MREAFANRQDRTAPQQTGPRSLHVVVNGLSAKTGGAIIVARSLVRSMAALRPQHRFTFLCSIEELADFERPANVAIEHHPRLAAILARTLWEQCVLPTRLRRAAGDVLLSLGGYAIFATAVPQVAVWQNPNVVARIRVPWRARVRAYIWLQRQVQRWSLPRAAQNVFLTANTVEDASHWFRMDRVPHCVIHSGIELTDLPSSPPPPSARSHLAISVGHTYFHKNYEAMIDAMARYRERFDDALELVIVGGAVDETYDRRLRQRVVDLELSERVRMPGPLPRDQVLRLMQEAKLYVVTSLLETFGLTLPEAMACGVPVVCGRASCLPEVCGDAVAYCDPRDPDDIASALHRVATNEALQLELREAGLARVGEFSWERAAEAYLREVERAATADAGGD